MAHRKKRDERFIDKRYLGSPIQEKEKKAHGFLLFFLFAATIVKRNSRIFIYLYIYIYIYIY